MFNMNIKLSHLFLFKKCKKYMILVLMKKMLMEEFLKQPFKSQIEYHNVVNQYKSDVIPDGQDKYNFLFRDYLHF